jgi:SAM-dependent methyltransferase
MSALRERIRQRIEGEIPELSDFRPSSLAELEEKREDAANWASLVGTVNPRAGRFYDPLVQALKRLMARALRWHGYPQQRLNQAQLEALAEVWQLLAEQNRNLTVLAQAIVQAQGAALEAQETALRSLRETEALGAAVPPELPQRVAAAAGEIERARQQFQEQLQDHKRSLEGRIVSNVAELRAKLDALELNLGLNVQQLNASLNKMQETFWADLAQLREKQAETLAQELRLIRQRLARVAAGLGTTPALSPAERSGAPDSPPAPPGAAIQRAVPDLDYGHFEDRFRGMEADVRERQSAYLPLFQGHTPVLDVACGRGEFLACLAQNGVEARGVDSDPDMVARCRERGLNVECADAFDYLAALPEGSLGAIFSAQFIEHLPPAEYIRLIRLAHQKLRKGGLLLLETQNPECLVTLSHNFYLDPTHLHPVPVEQLRFLMEEAGFCELATHYLSPVPDRFPALPLFNDPAFNPFFQNWDHAAIRFNQTYFGYQDYAVAGTKA